MHRAMIRSGFLRQSDEAKTGGAVRERISRSARVCP